MEKTHLLRDDTTSYSSMQGVQSADGAGVGCKRLPSLPSEGSAITVKAVAQDNAGRRGQRARLLLMSAVVFLDSLTGRLHSLVVTQYTYQVFTQHVYGNASVDVSVSVQPCVNATDPSNTVSLRDEVQSKSADLLMWLDLVGGLIAVVTNCFLGAYSDVLGRKFILLLPVLGHFLRNLTTPAIIYWDLGLTAMFSGYVIDGICGGSPGITLGLFVYTADVTPSAKQRTLGMALMEVAAGVATAAMDYAAGVFIQTTGFFYPALLSSVFLLICLTVIACWLPETVSRDRKKLISPVESARRMILVFTSHPKRKLLLLALLSLFLAYFVYIPISKVNSLYLMKQPFCWDSAHIGIFEAVRSVVGSLSSFAVVGLLHRVLSTPSLTIIGAASCAGSFLVLGLARTDLAVYMVPVVGLASNVMFPAVRSMMSRMVTPDKQGAMFAGVAVVESVCVASGPLAVMSLYTGTESVLPGMTYFCAGGLYVVVIGTFLAYVCALRAKVLVCAPSASIQADDKGS